MEELLKGLSKAEETEESISFQKRLKESERLYETTEDDSSPGLDDYSFSTPRKGDSARRATSSRMSDEVLNSAFSSPNSDDGREMGKAKKRSRALPDAADWAENIKHRALQTSFLGRLPSHTPRKPDQRNPRAMANSVKLKVQLRSEQVQELIGKLSLSEQSQHMHEVAVSMMTGSQGEKLKKIRKVREVIYIITISCWQSYFQASLFPIR